MPFQPIHFSQLETVGLPWLRDFHENLQKGMQTYNMPEQIKQEFEQKQLANALQRENVAQMQALTPFAMQNAQSNASILSNTAKYAPQVSQAELALKLAEANKANQLAQYGGFQPTGEAQNLMFAHRLIETGIPANIQKGRDILKNLNAIVHGRELRNEYLPQSAASPEGKKFIEMDRYDKTILDPKSTPEQVANAQRAKRGTQLALIADTSDPATRDLIDKGTNMLKTIDNLDIEAIVKGAGLGGKAWAAKQAAKVPFGTQSKAYDKYAQATKALEILTKQVGQFYKTPAAEASQERLAELISKPGFWSNPRLYQAEFDQIKSILQQEHDTYQSKLLYQLNELQPVTGRPQVVNPVSGQQNQGPRRRTLNTDNWSFQ